MIKQESSEKGEIKSIFNIYHMCRADRDTSLHIHGKMVENKTMTIYHYIWQHCQARQKNNTLIVTVNYQP